METHKTMKALLLLNGDIAAEIHASNTELIHALHRLLGEREGPAGMVVPRPGPVTIH